MPEPKDRDHEVPPPQAAAEPGVAKFETKIEHSAVAATAVGDGSHATGNLQMRGTTINAQTVILAGAVPGTPARFLKATPSYPDTETRLLSEKLADAQARKQRLQTIKVDVSDVTREILDLKRRLREGGQLKAGDFLGEGRFLLLEVLGHGGFGTVWRAHDANRDEIVAVKVLHSNLAGDRVRLDRFKRGARVMGVLEHEAVVRILEPYGEDGGWHYFVMEYLAGGDLRDAVLENRVDDKSAIALIIQLCVGLARAHDRGVIHRDIKPANILLGADGRPKITDFDLVGAADTTGGTRTGALGTLLYTAPEIFDHPMDADARSDVYSLGMTAAFCLHGKELPRSVFGQAEKVIETFKCSDAVKRVIEKATRFEPPWSRFTDARDLGIALTRAETVREPAPPANEQRSSLAANEPGGWRLWLQRAQKEDAISVVDFEKIVFSVVQKVLGLRVYKPRHLLPRWFNGVADGRTHFSTDGVIAWQGRIGVQCVLHRHGSDSPSAAALRGIDKVEQALRLAATGGMTIEARTARTEDGSFPDFIVVATNISLLLARGGRERVGLIFEGIARTTGVKGCALWDLDYLSAHLD